MIPSPEIIRTWMRLQDAALEKSRPDEQRLPDLERVRKLRAAISLPPSPLIALEIERARAALWIV